MTFIIYSLSIEGTLIQLDRLLYLDRLIIRSQPSALIVITQKQIAELNARFMTVLSIAAKKDRLSLPEKHIE
ncbi:MAG TPA: hypothetical protein DCY91_05505 [Cyanobacteria bacterium UBA11370]|nr:hypothetical protein [Cyanobacteria bacterium UBA11370]HBY79064.1 hypothetical protein [Cyanobacteria bacterium UBA11148]